MGNIKVTINGKIIETPQKTRVYELLEQVEHCGKFPAIGAIVNQRLVGLYHKLYADCEVRTIDFSDREGMDIYRRTACLILYSALSEIAPEVKVAVGQSLSDGYFFEVKENKISEKLLRNLEKKMREIVENNSPMAVKWITVEEAMSVFEKTGQEDKISLLKQSKRSDTAVVDVGGFCGSTYGPVANRTGLIDKFAIYQYEHGFVLAFPDVLGVVTKKIPSQPKLFSTYLETKRWYSLLNIENIAQLNEHCMRSSISEVVKVAEALHERKIASIADEIINRKHVRLILIAGPSGSGKTTFMKRLDIQLRVHGFEPVTISLDNYYIDRDLTPKHPNGSFNFEDLNALDIDLLNDNLNDLMKGKNVQIPSYSFTQGKRLEGSGKNLLLKKNQVLIVEGIHGLNNDLTPEISADKKFKIFVSALTQLCIDDHNRIFTTDTRLVRRIVRDRFFRGTSAANTIEGWESVRMGEKKYIFPYQEGADAVFNSALLYEHALLKPYAERFLMEVPREHPSFMESARLIRFFSLFIPVLSREVPQTSILREFIGGSAFRYT